MSASRDGAVRVWNTVTSDLIHSWSVTCAPAISPAVYALLPLPGSRYVLSAGQELILWEWRTQRVASRMRSLSPNTIHHCVLLPANRIAVAGDGPEVVFYTIRGDVSGSDCYLVQTGSVRLDMVLQAVEGMCVLDSTFMSSTPTPLRSPYMVLLCR
jgi:hypothetical protein